MLRPRNYLKNPITPEERRNRAAYYRNYQSRVTSIALTMHDPAKKRSAEG